MFFGSTVVAQYSMMAVITLMKEKGFTMNKDGWGKMQHEVKADGIKKNLWSYNVDSNSNYK